MNYSLHDPASRSTLGLETAALLNAEQLQAEPDQMVN